MKILKGLISFFIIITIPFCSIQNKEQGEQKIINHFYDYAKNSDNVKSASILIHSDQWKIHLESSLNKDQFNQPYHIASVGKVFTNTLIYQLVHLNKLKLNDKITNYIPKDILGNLFLIHNKDLSEEVTIQMLLDHTSGVADYFEGDSSNSGIKEIRSQPDKMWSPIEILEYTKTNFKPYDEPGKTFHYSDTGYILLGLVLERVYKDSFQNILQNQIFKPLNMVDSYLHLRSKPISGKTNTISKIMLEDLDVTNYKSISMDWAGGGIISTNQDLLLFQKALWNGYFFPKSIVDSWVGSNRFHDGIYYGIGFMTVRFGDMLFLMKGTPDLYGHSGLLSTLMFYSPEYDLHIISNFGSTSAIAKSFEMLFFIMKDVKEIISIQNR